jgi:type I restriction enzyme, S subunit
MSASGWHEIRLGDLVEITKGNTYRSVDLGPSTTALVTLKSFERGGGYRHDGLKAFTGQYKPEQVVNPGEIVIALTDVTQAAELVGRPAKVPRSLGFKTLVASVDAGIVRPVSDQIDSQFLYYLLLSPQLKDWTYAHTTGTTVLHLNPNAIKAFAASIPPLSEQREIASALSVLDDKIELNRRMNTALEAMARALFQSWFVDFDPVHAKAEGRQPVGMGAETAALFPDSFEDSALGPIPKGWQINSIDEIANFLNGLALQKFPVAGERSLPVIKIAQLRNGHDTLRADRCARKIPEEFVVQNGDVLFSWSGSLEVEIWSGGEGALNQHLFKVTSERYPKWYYYLWIITHLEDFRSIASGKATTMGHIQRKHLTAAKALVPSHELMVRMHEILNPIIEQANAFELQVKELRQLRDALLPKLLSGELRVREVAA